MANAIAPIDPVAIVAAANADRRIDLRAAKFAKMAEGPFAFLRGGADLYFARLDKTKHQDAPLGWMSGDLHLENFGVYRAADGSTPFDINDFDQCALLPASVEMVRFASSAIVAGDGKSIARAAATKALIVYLETLANGDANGWGVGSAGKLVKVFQADQQGEDQTKWLKNRKEKAKDRRVFSASKSNRDITARERAELKTAAKSLAAGRFDAKPEAWFEFRDAKFRATGLGSLGVRHYAILVRGDGDPDANCILDLKAARAAVGSSLWTQPAFANPAARVATIQSACQASPPHVGTVTMGGDDFVVRQAFAQDEKISIRENIASWADFTDALCDMARIAACSHLRAAGQHGAAPAADFVRWAGKADVAAIIELAARAADDNDKDYAVFKAAAAAKDPRLFGGLPKP